MLRQEKLRRSASIMFLALTACGAPSARAATLKAESASAATNPRTQELATTIVLRNVAGKTIQAFMMTIPSATDDDGNGYTSTSLSGSAIGGVAVCSSATRCLMSEKEQTESSATQIDPNETITLTVAFCCKMSSASLPAKASAGIVLQVREGDGNSFGAWRSVSVGVADIAVKAGK